MMKNNLLQGMLALLVAMGLGTLGCGGADGSDVTQLPAEQLTTGQVVVDLSQGPAAYELAPGQDFSRVSVLNQSGTSAHLDELIARSAKAKGLRLDEARRVVVTNSQDKAAQLFPGHQFQSDDGLRTQLTEGGAVCDSYDIIIIFFEDAIVIILICN
jgi:hypothetical protein